MSLLYNAVKHKILNMKRTCGGKNRADKYVRVSERRGGGDSERRKCKEGLMKGGQCLNYLGWRGRGLVERTAFNHPMWRSRWCAQPVMDGSSARSSAVYFNVHVHVSTYLRDVWLPLGLST